MSADVIEEVKFFRKQAAKADRMAKMAGELGWL